MSHMCKVSPTCENVLHGGKCGPFLQQRNAPNRVAERRIEGCVSMVSGPVRTLSLKANTARSYSLSAYELWSF